MRGNPKQWNCTSPVQFFSPNARKPRAVELHIACAISPPCEGTQSSGITHRLCNFSPPVRENLKQWNCTSPVQFLSPMRGNLEQWNRTSPVQFLPPAREHKAVELLIACVISLPASASQPPTRARSRYGVTQTYRFRSHVYAPPQMLVGAPLVGALAPPDAPPFSPAPTEDAGEAHSAEA